MKFYHDKVVTGQMNNKATSLKINDVALYLL